MTNTTTTEREAARLPNGSRRVVVQVCVTPALAERLRRLAAEEQRTVSNLGAVALSRFVGEHERELATV